MSNVQEREEVHGGAEGTAGVDADGSAHREEQDVPSGTRVLHEGRGLLPEGRNETRGSFRSPFDSDGDNGEETPSRS